MSSRADRDGGRGRVFRVVLPWPPSVNGMYRGGRKQIYMTKGARDWYRASKGVVEAAPGFSVCRSEWASPGLDGKGRALPGPPLRVSIILVPPTAHKLDIDNRIKPVHDCLEKAELFGNDSQIKVAEQVLLKKLTGGVPGAFVTVERLPIDFGAAMVEIPLFNGRM